MTLKLKLPENLILKPTITVFGIGGAGGNAVNNMIRSNLQGAKFVVANTDAQALEHSLAENKIQLGAATTRGLGAGASPEIGELAAKESEADIKEALAGSNMVFITAGMGGGTGTGAAPEIAKIAREEGILTVGVVTKPFHFEGQFRMKLCEKGLEKMQQNVDTLIIIPNQNLFHIATERTTFADAFKMADDVLHSGVRGITDLMIMPGLINLDFADIKAVMSEMGKAMMGTGEASGDEDRAIRAAEAAISNPLLDHRSVRGAKGVLINITGGMDMTLFEVDAAANRIREEVGDDADSNIIFGSTFNKDLDGTIRVSVVATGIDAENYKISTKLSSVSVGEEIVNIQEEEIETITRDIEKEEFSPDENHDSLDSIDDYKLEETSDIHNIREIAPIVATEEDKKPAKKPSIFSRVFGSLSSESNTATEKQAQNTVQKPMPKTDRVEPVSESSDILDVPTFLRRK
jgi:cell division protein FtsZ